MAALDVARKMVSPLTAAVVLAVFSVADLAWNNAPNESTGLPPSLYDALRRDTANETVALLKSRLADAAPDRRDRVELIGIGYHWPNLGLVHDFDHLFGAQPAAAVGFRRARPRPPTRSRCRSSASSRRCCRRTARRWKICSACASSPSACRSNRSTRTLKPDDLSSIARTKDAYVYENPRALPRVMLLGDWRHANFEHILKTGWPDVDPKPHGAAGDARRAAAGLRKRHGADRRATATPRSWSRRTRSAPSLLVLNDVWHPWWRACVDGAPEPTSSRPTCCSARSRCRRANTSCASASTRSRGALAQLWDKLSAPRAEIA